MLKMRKIVMDMIMKCVSRFGIYMKAKFKHPQSW